MAIAPLFADLLPLVPHPNLLLRSPPFIDLALLPASPSLQVSACKLAGAAASFPGRSGSQALVAGRPSSTASCLITGVMGRSQLLLSIFLLLPLLFSVGHGAALSFHDIWNLVLPHSASPAAVAAVPDHFPHGEMRSRLPTTGEAGDQGSSGEVIDQSTKTRVDAGTKAWPFVYYAKRDREGTLDWGTKSWPYIYFSKREDKGDLTASSDAAGAAAVNYGRKVGHGFRL